MLTQRLVPLLLFSGLLTSTITADHACSDGILNGTDKKTISVRCDLRRGITRRCTHGKWECDETLDCEDGMDEFSCGYLKSFVYEYDYRGYLYFPHKDVNMHIKVTILLRKSDEDFFMKFENPVLTQSKMNRTNLLSSEEKNAWKMVLKFKYNNGIIGNIYHESGHPEDILNMKKAIISMFQLKLETAKIGPMINKYHNIETDVTGRCKVRYETKHENVKAVGEFKDIYKIQVTKTNDFTDCEERPLNMYQDMDTIKCDEKPGTNIPKSRMKTNCTFYIREDRVETSQAIINHCESHERQELEFPKKSGESSYVIVTIRKELQLRRIKIEFWKQNNWVTKSSLLFNFDGLYHMDKSSVEILDEVKETLDGLNRLVNQETKAWDLISAEAPILYSKLIKQLQWKVDDTTFKDIYQQYYNEDKYRTWLESALPYIGSDASGEEIKDKIETGSISGMSAIKLFTRLGVVKRPTKLFCDNIMDLCETSAVSKDSTVHATCWLAFGSLVHTYCKEMSSCPALFIEALRRKFHESLHTQGHHFEVTKDNDKLIVALKAIGNSGQKRLLHEVLHIITTWDDNYAIMTAAIEATRRMALNDTETLTVQRALRDIYVDREMCTEIRIVAFEELIKIGPNKTEIISSLERTMRTEVNPLMKQFVYTFLDTESKLKCQAKRSRKTAIDLLARTANLPRPSFDPRHSFYKSFSYGIPEILSQGYNIESVYTTDAIPTFIKLENYITLLGHYWEQIEHKARQQGAVSLLRKLFGPYGMMDEKKSLWDFIRVKRSVDSDGFPSVYKRMKEMLNPSKDSRLPFKTTLSSKMYGSEILYLVLSESHTLIQNLMKDGTIRVDRDWWANSLKAGVRFNTSANDILFDAMRKIPTSIGIPLKMKINTAGIFAYGLYVDAKASPMFNLLSWNNKLTDISGNYKESFSLSTSTKAMAYVFYRNLKLGYISHQNTSSRLPLPIEKITFSGQIPSQKYSIGAVMSKRKYVFSESSHVFHRFVKLGDDYMKYETNDWNLRAPKVSVTPGLGLGVDGDSPGHKIASMVSDFQFSGMETLQGSGPPQAHWGPKTGEKKPSGQRGADNQNPRDSALGARSSYNETLEVSVDAQSSSTGPPMGKSCFESWNNSMKACINRDNETLVTQLWFDPNERVIDEVVIKYQNITKKKETEWKFLGEFHVNGKNNVKIAEYHMELNLTTSAKNLPMHWDLTRDDLSTFSGGFSTKAYEIKSGVKSFVICAKPKVNIPRLQWDLEVKWGKSCHDYSINMSSALYYKDGGPNVNISLEWDSLPPNIERMICPTKYLEVVKKMQELEKMKSSYFGYNAGMGGHEGKPGGMSGDPGNIVSKVGGAGAAGSMGAVAGGMSPGAGGMSAGAGGMSAGAGGMSAGAGGMGNGAVKKGGGRNSGWPEIFKGISGGSEDISGAPKDMGGWPGAIGITSGGTSGWPGAMTGAAGGMDAFHCMKRFDIMLSLRNSTTLKITTTATPPLNLELTFNGTKALEKARETITYGITETCTAYSSNEITTFDQHTFEYDKSKGCPHVLAKDCSEKDLFTVFMKKDETNKTIYTMVVKDKRGKGHVYVINPDLTIAHDGTLLQFSGGVHDHQVCKVTMRDSLLAIKCKAGVTLVASHGKLQIKVTPWYFNYMCGMCGNFNWDENDDFIAPQDYREETSKDTFGTSWLVPGETCNSECKLVYRPDIQSTKDKVCISTSPVTRCAPFCQPTRQASSKRSYHCLDNGTDEANEVAQKISDEKYDEILKTFSMKNEDMKAQADVHMDCQCTCPAPKP